MRPLFFTIATFFALKAFPQSALYTLGDLEMLYKDKNIVEYLAHAKDVRPSDRGNHWKEMTHEMAISFIDLKLKKASYEKEDLKVIEDISLWTEFQKDEFFQTKRAIYGEKYFKTCIESEKSKETFHPEESACLKGIYTFWNNTPPSPSATELGLKFGELLKNNNVKTDYWSFYARAGRDEASELLCRKDGFYAAFKDKILTLLEKNISEELLSKELRNLLNDDCFKSIEEKLLKDLRSTSKEEAKLSFMILNRKKRLSPEDQDLFFVSYVLNNPQNGELLNSAWNELKNLGEDHFRREKILSKIKQLDPLPGKTFAIEDEKRKKVILDYFSLHFPEYMNLYAKTCLSYLKGIGSFPMGNPTMECREFYKATKNTKFISPLLQSELESILR